MKDNIKVVTFGCGFMGRNVTRFMKERGGFDHVACIGRKSHLGEDIGEVSGIGPVGAKIYPVTDLGKVYDELKPDVVFDTGSGWPDVVNNTREALVRGIPVMALAEEFFSMKEEYPDECAELDALAKEHGTRFIGLGMQDVNWVNKCVVMSSNSHRIDRIIGQNTCILDFAGASEFDRVGLNMTEEEFYEYHAADPAPDNPFTYSLYQIAEELHLHVTGKTNDKTTPIFAPDDYTSKFLSPKEAAEFGGTIKKGRVMGARRCSTLHTKEGVDLVGEFLYDWLFDETHTGFDRWTFEGEPTWDVLVKEGRYDIGTTTDLVNRVADVLNCEKNGYITGADLPKPFYHFGPLNEYVED